MKTVSLDQFNRIKRMENHEAAEKIRITISNRINKEYNQETRALRDENENLYAEEKVFNKQVQELLNGITPATPLRVITQVGPGDKIFNTYTGHLQKDPGFMPTYFNFVSPERNNKPFTIGFSCLQSIEILDDEE